MTRTSAPGLGATFQCGVRTGESPLKLPCTTSARQTPVRTLSAWSRVIPVAGSDFGHVDKAKCTSSGLRLARLGVVMVHGAVPTRLAPPMLISDVKPALVTPGPRAWTSSRMRGLIGQCVDARRARYDRTSARDNIAVNMDAMALARVQEANGQRATVHGRVTRAGKPLLQNARMLPVPSSALSVPSSRAPCAQFFLVESSIPEE